MKLKCVVCGEVVEKRHGAQFRNPSKINSGGGQIMFPVAHINPQTNDPCHGFYMEAFEEVE
jgi:hypothetical protein